MSRGRPAAGPGSPAPPAARLHVLLAVANAALFAAYAGVNAILIPARIAALDPRHKVTDVALVAGLSAVCALVANPVGGLASDRTVSRFGKRRPWLLAGAGGTVAGLAWLASAGSLLVLALAQGLTQAMLNVFQAALTAIVPDRVPASRRGTVSAVIGVAVAAGTAGGTAVAAVLVRSRLAYGVLALLVLGAALLMVTMPEPPARRSPGGPPAGVTARAGRPWVRNGDLGWVFAGRAAMILSYNLVFVYLLYIVADYVRKPAGLGAARGVAILTVVSVATSVLAIIAGGVLADRLRRYRAFVFVAGLLGGSAMILPALSPSWHVIVACAAIEGLAVGAYLAVDTALVTLVLPSPRTAARDLGLMNIANAGPPVIAPFLASFIVLGAGYRAVFAGSTAIALVASVTIWRVRGVR